MRLRRMASRVWRGRAGSPGLAAFLLLLATLSPVAYAQSPPPAPAPSAPPPAMPYPTAPESCRRCYVQTRFLTELQKLPVDNDRVAVHRGVGIFYTTEKSKYIAPIRNLVNETIEGLHEVTDHPEEAHLCLNCRRDFRIYSQVEHEIVPLKRGVLALLTSDDEEVAKILQIWYLPRTNFIDMEEFRKQMEVMRKEAEKMRVNGGR